MVCKACMEASLSAQLDSKPLLQVGCTYIELDVITLLGRLFYISHTSLT